MIKAVIFDMDNTLIDTITMQHRSYSKVVSEFGKNLDPDDLNVSQYIIHFEEPRNWEIIIDKYQISEHMDVLMQKRNDVYEEILRNQIILRPGIEALLDLLKRHQYKMAVGSNSFLSHIHAALEGMGKQDYFSAISSAETLPRKPAPDIFLDAARQLQCRPEECLVIEDAELGIQAGKRAGMKVVAVPNVISRKTEDMSHADIQLNSLEQFDFQILTSMQ
jgi:HAD superfamily hydrolase (TIGR01509 family)